MLSMMIFLLVIYVGCDQQKPENNKGQTGQSQDKVGNVKFSIEFCGS